MTPSPSKTVDVRSFVIIILVELDLSLGCVDLETYGGISFRTRPGIWIYRRSSTRGRPVRVVCIVTVTAWRGLLSSGSSGMSRSRTWTPDRTQVYIRHTAVTVDSLIIPRRLSLLLLRVRCLRVILPLSRTFQGAGLRRISRGRGRMLATIVRVMRWHWSLLSGCIAVVARCQGLDLRYRAGSAENGS